MNGNLEEHDARQQTIQNTLSACAGLIHLLIEAQRSTDALSEPVARPEYGGENPKLFGHGSQVSRLDALRFQMDLLNNSMHALDTDLRARAADVDEAFRYKVQSRQTALDDALRNMTTLTGVPKL